MENIQSLKFYKAKKRGSHLLYTAFRTIILLGLSFVVLYPLIYILSVTFRSISDITDPGVIWIPKHFVLTNISDAFKFMDYPNSVFNSIKFGIVSSMLQIASCALVGYGFARFNFKGKNLLFSLALFTIIVPQSVVYIPTYLMYRDFDFFGIVKLINLIIGSNMSINLLDTPFTVYMPNALGVGLRSGLFIYIFRQFFRGLPQELEDAAYIDGCGSFKTFLQIVLPNAVTAIITCVLFSIVWNWNDYFTISMYFSDSKTVSVALAGLRDAMTSSSAYESIRSDPYMMATRMEAGCLLCITPLLIIFMFLQKYFTQGIERTGIVG